MKKLLVLALALVLTLGVATMASASTFAGSVGGEYQITYSPDVNENDPVLSFLGDTYGARFKSYVVGTVEDKDTNTWAKIGCLISTWNLNQSHTATTTVVKDPTDDTGATALKDTDTGSPLYTTAIGGSDVAAAIFEAGIKQIAGSKVDVWYTNDENGNTKRGMVPLWTPWFKFGGDPAFSNGVGNVLGVDYNGDNATVNFIYGLNNGGADANLTIAAATFKFEGGNVWAGYRLNANESSQMGVGAEFKAGFGTIKADYISNEPVDGAVFQDGTKADTATSIQVDFLILNNKLDLTAYIDDGVYFVRKGGSGFGVTYNFTDKFYVGGKSLTASKKIDEASNLTNMYVGFVYGIFDTRIGSYTAQNDNGKDESYVYLTSHVGMW